MNLAINKAAEILIPQKAAMEELMERLMVHNRLEREVSAAKHAGRELVEFVTKSKHLLRNVVR